jgi:anti-sigma regulatory factor (Ser/Thr protein kinase)
MRLAMELVDDPISVPICRHALRGVLQDLGIDRMRAYEIELVVGEAAGNVVRHAYAGPGNMYRVELEVFTDAVRLSVTDRGRGFDRASLDVPGEEMDSGRGIMLIEQVADATRLEWPATGGTQLTAEFRLRPPRERSPTWPPLPPEESHQDPRPAPPALMH